jgi:hypothetical protein
MPFPQFFEQSGSVSCAAAWQHPSFTGVARRISSCAHDTVQSLPMRVSVVQGM